MTAEERMMWVERYSALPTGNVADAMDGLGLKRGSVLGLHPIDPSQKRAAGFARTILQKRRSTPWDGMNLAKHGKVIDDKTEPGDLLVISMGLCWRGRLSWTYRKWNLIRADRGKEPMHLWCNDSIRRCYRTGGG